MEQGGGERGNGKSVTPTPPLGLAEETLRRLCWFRMKGGNCLGPGGHELLATLDFHEMPVTVCTQFSQVTVCTQLSQLTAPTQFSEVTAHTQFRQVIALTAHHFELPRSAIYKYLGDDLPNERSAISRVQGWTTRPEIPIDEQETNRCSESLFSWLGDADSPVARLLASEP